VTRFGTVEFFAQPGASGGVGYPITASWSPSVAFVPGADVAVVASGAFVYFANPLKYEKPARVKTGSRTVVSVVASPDGKLVLVGGRPGAVEVFDVESRTRTTSYDFGIGGLHSLAYAPDGLTFAAAGDTGLVVCDSPG
jgi:hypothetical protein